MRKYRFKKGPTEKPHTGGHYVDCGYKYGHYKMSPYWIDTDNKVWSEPYHLYGIE